MCGGLAAWMVGPPLSLSVCLVVLGPIGVPSAALLPLLAGRAAEEGRKEGRGESIQQRCILGSRSHVRRGFLFLLTASFVIEP